MRLCTTPEAQANSLHSSRLKNVFNPIYTGILKTRLDRGGAGDGFLPPRNFAFLYANKAKFCTVIDLCKGGFPVMAEITRILAANIRRQCFFVIATATSTRCLVQNFQLICYSQRVNATSQYNDSGSSACSKWLNYRMVVVVKIFWLLV